MAEYCAIHPDAISSGRCEACSRPFCPECIVEDVAADLSFCSVACRNTYQSVRPRDRTELIAGLRKPILTGWRLALGRAGAASLWVGVPAGLAYGLLRVATVGSIWGEAGEASLLHDLGLLGCIGLAAAAVGILLSDAHTGAAFANPWPRVARRILPWATTWFLVASAIVSMSGASKNWDNHGDIPNE